MDFSCWNRLRRNQLELNLCLIHNTQMGIVILKLINTLTLLRSQSFMILYRLTDRHTPKNRRTTLIII